MDLFRFINSRDIREFLQEQHYVFNSLEAAWLIYQCRTVSLKEKHIAWKELIHTMPDCEMPERINCEYRNSLHGFLKEYMAFQNETISDFFHASSNAVYRTLGCYDENSQWIEFSSVSSTYKTCLNCLLSSGEHAKQYTIQKQYFDSSKYIRVYVRNDGALLSISSNEISNEEQDDLYYQSFDGLWFDFPVPFRKGDIIWNPFHPEGFCGGPFVMAGICTQDSPEDVKKRLAQSGDTSDMTVSGYFLDKSGNIYPECTSNYMDCEYYTGHLTGTQNFFPVLKRYLQQNIDLSLLLKVYHYYKVEHVLDNCALEQYEQQFLPSTENL